MKKFKFFALGIIGAGLITAGLFACSNEDTNNTQEENIEQISKLQGKLAGDKLIAREEADGTLTLLFDKEQFKEDLINEGLFAEVESVEIGEDRLTIIGKDTNDFSLTAFQAELIKEGNELYFPNPSDPELPNTTFAKHSCAGNPCTSCDFTRSGNGGPFSRITGCTCGSGGTCNHTKSGQDPLDTAKDILDIAIKVIGIFK